jgi:hypothetical protein
VEASDHQVGGAPTLTIMADVSGRHQGRPEVLDFLKSLFAHWPGVVQDDSEEVWSPLEVFADRRQNGRRFFDY